MPTKMFMEKCAVARTYSKTPLLRPPLGLRTNGLYSGVVLLLSKDKEEINEMGL